MFCSAAPSTRATLLLLLLSAASLTAQRTTGPSDAPNTPPLSQLTASANAETMSVVTPSSLGRLSVHTPAGWVASSIALDEGTSPVVTLSDAASSVAISYSLFASQAPAPTPESCRAQALAAMTARLKSDVKVKQRDDTSRTAQTSTPLATASLVLVSADEAAPDSANQADFFAFAAGTDSCAELHLSQAPATALDDALLQSALSTFTFEPNYAPTAADYAHLAALFSEQVNDQPAAAAYYRRALLLLPDDATTRSTRRRYTNELTNAYILAQDRADARALNQAALKSDPDYALYDYQLACLDAEDNDPVAARLHLQEAFAHRSGMPPGESLPSPRTDDSLLKLKKNKPFWHYAEHVH